MEDEILLRRLSSEKTKGFLTITDEINLIVNEMFEISESMLTRAFSLPEEEFLEMKKRFRELKEERDKLDAERDEFVNQIKAYKQKSVLGEIMGVEGASAIWGLSPERIKHLCSEGKLRSVKIGKTWIIDKNQDNPSKRKPKAGE